MFSYPGSLWGTLDPCRATELQAMTQRSRRSVIIAMRLPLLLLFSALLFSVLVLLHSLLLFSGLLSSLFYDSLLYF